MVTVVIACRNAEATLAVQLDALARQECPLPWNVVISDNGSRDGTVALARSYAHRLPGLIVVDSSAGTGAGYARNVGAAATRAPLLVFCDADDEAAKGWLAAMVTALQRDPFVAGRFESGRLNDSRVLRSRSLQQSCGLQESPFGPDLPHAGAGNLGLTRELFLSVGGFDPAVACLEDTDLCWRIQLDGVPLAFCPAAVMHVRLRSSLRTMWAQGRAYGSAAAQLEHRYPQPPRDHARRGTSGPGVVHDHGQVLGPVPGRVARGVRLVRERRSAGALLWKLGWHLGHRRWRPVSMSATASPFGSPSRQAG